MVVAEVGLMAGAQRDFVDSAAYSPALIAGRGSGKTWAFVAKAFKYAIDNSEGRGVLTQPTFDMIRRNFMPVWEKQWGRLAPDVWQWRLIQAGVPSEIAFYNGFVYDLRPATAEMAEKFRGATYCVAGMDELRNEDQLPCYLALTGAVRDPDRPNQFFITSTPEARRPWIRKIWGEHIDPISGRPLPPEDYPKFKTKTEDNWKLDEAQKARIRAMYGGDSRYARQELDAEDVALEGVAFEEFGIIHIAEPPEGHVFNRVLGCLDFGATSPTALYELKLDAEDTVWVTREFYKRNADDYDWVTAAADWGLHEVRCDPARSHREIEDLRRRYGVNLKSASPPAKRFDTRVRLMRNRLALRAVGLGPGKPKMYISASCPNLRAELQNLAFAQPKIGEFATDKWEAGCSDHGFDAVCYGLSDLDLGFPSIVNFDVSYKL